MNDKHNPLLDLLDEPSYIAIPALVFLMLSMAFLIIVGCFLLGSAMSYVNHVLNLGIPLGF